MKKSKKLKVTAFSILIFIILANLIPYIFFSYIAQSFDPRGGSGNGAREENRKQKIERCEQVSTSKFGRKLCFIWETQKEITIEYDTTTMIQTWCVLFSGDVCKHQ